MLNEREFGYHPSSSDHLHQLVRDIDCRYAITWLRYEVHDVERDGDLGMLWVVDVDYREQGAVRGEGKVRTFRPPGERTEHASNVEIGVGGIVIIPSHNPR